MPVVNRFDNYMRTPITQTLPLVSKPVSTGTGPVGESGRAAAAAAFAHISGKVSSKEESARMKPRIDQILQLIDEKYADIIPEGFDWIKGK